MRVPTGNVSTDPTAPAALWAATVTALTIALNVRSGSFSRTSAHSVRMPRVS